MLAARTCLGGPGRRFAPVSVNRAVELEPPGGASLVAVVTRTSVKMLGLEPGRAACAIFKASSVILGVAG
jgi:molybdate transport system regulatory protein